MIKLGLAAFVAVLVLPAGALTAAAAAPHAAPRCAIVQVNGPGDGNEPPTSVSFNVCGMVTGFWKCRNDQFAISAGATLTCREVHS